MGRGYTLRCGKCGYGIAADLGVGFDFPLVYMKTMEAARAGRYGATIRRFLEEHPDGTLNTERVLLQCTGCGDLTCGPDLSMYLRKPEVPREEQGRWSVAAPYERADYVSPTEPEHEETYELYARGNHCGKCGRPMKPITDNDLEEQLHRHPQTQGQTEVPCPKCREWLRVESMLDLLFSMKDLNRELSELNDLLGTVSDEEPEVPHPIAQVPATTKTEPEAVKAVASKATENEKAGSNLEYHFQQCVPGYTSLTKVEEEVLKTIVRLEHQNKKRVKIADVAFEMNETTDGIKRILEGLREKNILNWTSNGLIDLNRTGTAMAKPSDTKAGTGTAKTAVSKTSTTETSPEYSYRQYLPKYMLLTKEEDQYLRTVIRLEHQNNKMAKIADVAYEMNETSDETKRKLESLRTKQILGWSSNGTINLTNLWSRKLLSATGEPAPRSAGTEQFETVKLNGSTVIRSKQFQNLKITNLEVPEGVTEIQKSAFSFGQLEVLKLPGSLRKIGQQAFADNLNLKKIIFREGIREIDDIAFTSCKKLDAVTLPDSLQKVSYSAFTDEVLPPSAHIVITLSGGTARRLYTNRSFPQYPTIVAGGFVIDGKRYEKIEDYVRAWDAEQRRKTEEAKREQQRRAEEARREQQRRAEEAQKEQRRDQLRRQIRALESERDAARGLFAGMKRSRLQKQIDELNAQLRRL